jgi:hypothetical protein
MPPARLIRQTIQYVLYLSRHVEGPSPPLVLRRAAITKYAPGVIGGGVTVTAIERPPPAEGCVAREAERAGSPISRSGWWQLHGGAIPSDGDTPVDDPHVIRYEGSPSRLMVREYCGRGQSFCQWFAGT